MGEEKWSKSKRLFFIREWAFNILLAMYFSYFAASHLRDYFVLRNPSSLLFIGFESLIVILALVRHLPKEVSFRSVDWIAAGIGTYLPLMFKGAGSPYINQGFLFMQFAGICISFVGIISLNRCFGVVPSNRGIQTGGLYKFIRHPIYTGYFISLTFYVIQNQSLRNYIILIIALVAKVVRIHCEERVLMKDPDYQELARKTKWRIFPGIW